MKQMINKIPSLVFHNGTKIPQLGFGTYKVKGDDTKAVTEAINLGYRHIDDASLYENQKQIGAIIKQCGIPRQQLFITSKVWTSHMSEQKARQSVLTSLKDLGLAYLDLLLIHWPSVDGVDPKDGNKLRQIRLEVWKAFIQMKKQGLVKNIGVSNFLKKHLQPLMQTQEIPVVNQIMLNPYFVQEEEVEFCKKHGILIQSWSPLARSGFELMEDPVITSIAEKHKRSSAQICLRWNVQHGNVILPKSVTPARIAQNMKIFDFQLSKEEMKQIDQLHKLGKMKPYQKMLCE